jgi:hypothetical protein
MKIQPHSTTSTNIPTWSNLLVEAVNKPGIIMAAYSAFHNYSVGNQILAVVQCQLRGIEQGPINTFPGWKALGRSVKSGERALTLCMPVIRKRKQENTDEANGEQQNTFTSFVYKPRWFVVSQTTGEDLQLGDIPGWFAAEALRNLDTQQIPFTGTDGNVQGYARHREIAVNPVAQLPAKTLLHELAHVVLGHTAELNFTDSEQTPKNLREVEAEAVALLCCESLNLDGAEFCRGYIQNWLTPLRGYEAETIPEKSAQKIFRAADQILRAGRTSTAEAEEHS